ncbi:MAPEG family protein [Hirschia baltica]|uniref:MAPEG family protein n=1 Tax=Hirschia baltica (strain ATCC 49814 / DSM 5838 / IFAM 1418) TaxID=582402 RepID=C6XPY8_HIRBI|nr:MAPEG family protein [Hirschia baltica]ACT58505.1 protein of unknown function DUF1123 [Hirschia baltica ATCC 49814]
MTMLTPVLLLIVWTLIILVLLASRRLPSIIANAKKGIYPSKRTQELAGLPEKSIWTSDNHTHLHEQPTLFYALCLYSHLVGVADNINIGLAFAYVVLRVIHSIIQTSTNNIIWRFRVFMTGTAILMIIALRNVWALFAGYLV